MAMMLRPPRGGAWLEVGEVVSRFQAEFKEVRTTKEGVDSYADSIAGSYRKQGHAALADRIDAVKNRGVAVVITDEAPERSVAFIVFPGVPLMAGFTSV